MTAARDCITFCAYCNETPGVESDNCPCLCHCGPVAGAQAGGYEPKPAMMAGDVPQEFVEKLKAAAGADRTAFQQLLVFAQAGELCTRTHLKTDSHKRRQKTK